MEVHKQPRLLYNALRAKMDQAESRGYSRGHEQSKVYRAEFADQVSLTALEDIEVELPANFAKSENPGRSLEVTVKAGSSVDNVPETTDTIEFSVGGQSFRVIEEQRPRVKYNEYHGTQVDHRLEIRDSRKDGEPLWLGAWDGLVV